MKVEQIYTKCLSEAAYYIESNGEVAIIDPLRETTPYIEKAKQNNAQIKYVFETHFHADFVSGHLDLAKQTGAKIVFGPNAQTNYDFHLGQHNEIFEIGNVKIKLLHTPGHTMESSCYLLFDENEKEYALFSGDTLFIGDVGRPDLAVKSHLTKEDLAAKLFDSLRNKIMPLPDDVIVYPAHGAGSACGKNMSKETFDTLRNQKKSNYALRHDMTKEEFIKEVSEGIADAPQYFEYNVQLNKGGYDNFTKILQKSNKALSLNEFKNQINKGAYILDVRNQNDFCSGFIPKSIFIGLNGQFAPWVGTIIQGLKTPILLIVNQGKEQEAITRLARVGYDNCIGYLDGGFEQWKNANEPIKTIQNISPEKLADTFKKEPCNIVDVRSCGEYNIQHIKDVERYNLTEIPSNLEQLDRDKKYYIHCAGGYRSVIAISLLMKNNYKNLINIEKGFTGIKQTNLPLI